MVLTGNPNDVTSAPCEQLAPSFLTHSIHAYPYVPTPSTLSWIALERQRLRNLQISGQNDYPYSYNVTRTFKGIKNDVPLACAPPPGDKADWRVATGNVIHQTHKHTPRDIAPAPPVRLPTICDIDFTPIGCPETNTPRSARSTKPPAPSAKSQLAAVNPESWRTNFYVPFSTLEPRPTGNQNNGTQASPRRHRLDVPPVDVVRWQSFTFQQGPKLRIAPGGVSLKAPNQ